jgi:IS5 family transposase
VIRPLIKHREFRTIQKAWNARMKKELYNQRNQCESVRSSISRKYGSFVRPRKWFKQFREELVKRIVYNIDRFLQLQLQ